MSEHSDIRAVVLHSFCSEGGGQEKGEGREGRGCTRKRKKRKRRRRKNVACCVYYPPFAMFSTVIHYCFQFYNYFLKLIFCIFPILQLRKLSLKEAIFLVTVAQLELELLQSLHITNSHGVPYFPIFF